MASQYPSVKLVTEPNDSTSTVLLDLHDNAPSGGTAPRAILAEGFSLGAPELEGEPDAIDPLYGPRTIEATLEVKGTKAQAFALISSLSRILVTGYTGGFIPGLWLRYQVTSTSTPYWFRLLRPNSAVLNWDSVYTKAGAPADQWLLDLDLPAEAFAYEARQTIAAQTVNNDPTAGTNPCRIDLGTIKGDAPAMLTVETVNAASDGTIDSNGLLISHASTSAVAAISVDVGTGDGLTATNGTAAAAALSNNVGGSSRTVSFSTTPGEADRLSGTKAMPPGRFRALVRVAMPTANTDTHLRLTLAGVPGSWAKVLQTSTAGTYFWVDLGLFYVPRLVQDGTYASTANATQTFALAARTGSTSATLVIDHLLFVPIQRPQTVDCRTILGPVSVDTASFKAVFNGVTQEHYVAATTAISVFDYPLVGSFPRVVPGVVNTLWVMNHVGPGVLGQDNQVAGSLSVTCYYHPRYLNVPAT